MTEKMDDRLARQSLELVKLFISITSDRQRVNILEIVRAAAYSADGPKNRAGNPVAIETREAVTI